MGYNTIIVIYNDSLSIIEQDNNFGRRLSKSIKDKYSSDKPIDFNTKAGNACHSAGLVVDCQHADNEQLIFVHQNHGEKFGNLNQTKKLSILKEYANKEGYTIRKLPKRKKNE